MKKPESVASIKKVLKLTESSIQELRQECDQMEQDLERALENHAALTSQLAAAHASLEGADELFIQAACLGLIDNKDWRQGVRKWIDTRPRQLAETSSGVKASRWVCPSCLSNRVQVSYPTWYRELQEGDPQLVKPDFNARILGWYCGDCGESEAGEPDELEDHRCRTLGCTEDAGNGEGFGGYCGNCADALERDEDDEDD